MFCSAACGTAAKLTTLPFNSKRRGKDVRREFLEVTFYIKKVQFFEFWAALFSSMPGFPGVNSAAPIKFIV
jgi:hypothetical protein